ncbi:MAG: CoA-binding protein [candidate division Zixibacteria bacterium]|nr:CoA-binding protein [candidate division Zixibacteria bacterium]
MSTVAILGASSNRDKFGNKSVRAHAHRGWTVFPINPKESEIEGHTVYKSIKDVPEKLDRVSVYLPAQIAMNVLDDIASMKPDEVYFNPGADDPEVLQKAEEKGLNVIKACSIVAIGLSPAQFE